MSILIKVSPFTKGGFIMAAPVPYKLQILLDSDIRKALRDVAHQHDTSIQKLVATWLIAKLKEYPAGQHLELPAQPLS